MTANRRRLVIAGAAGRDFHDFNLLWRDDPSVEVVAFTAAQIPGIAGRRYPSVLAGRLYPDGIPIVPEDELEAVCRAHAVDDVVFAYSDLTHGQVMHLAARAAAAGAGFVLPGARATMLASHRPVIAVTAVRTGSGKSQLARFIGERLSSRGLRVAALRHPMPYGDLAAQAVQRFATAADLDAADTTLEEREEYEPWIERGLIIHAGIDYAAILAAAEAEADIILWDGGNNDTPFILPDLHIVLTDALRPGHETGYWPGEANLRMAGLVVVAKADAARPADVEAVRAACARANPRAVIVRGGSPVRLDDPEAVRGRRAIVVDDGPTLTHGGMKWGAGDVAARDAGAEIVDPRPHADPAIAAVFAAFPHLGPVLPAMGYGREQSAALARTIAASGAEIVVAGTPVDLARLLGLALPVVRARYDFADLDAPAGVWAAVERLLAGRRTG